MLIQQCTCILSYSQPQSCYACHCYFFCGKNKRRPIHVPYAQRRKHTNQD